MNTIVGKNIADRRRELKLTQEELAEKLGYKSKSTINKIELGINDISQSKLVLFAKALNTTPGYLMGWEGSIKDVIPIQPEDEKRLLSLYNELNDEGKEIAINLLSGLIASGQYKKHDTSGMVEEEA